MKVEGIVSKCWNKSVDVSGKKRDKFYLRLKETGDQLYNGFGKCPFEEGKIAKFEYNENGIFNNIVQGKYEPAPKGLLSPIKRETTKISDKSTQIARSAMLKSMIESGRKIDESLFADADRLVIYIMTGKICKDAS